MSGKKEKKSMKRMTLKQKGIAALICLGAAAAWEFIWLGFPVEVYSVYNSPIGCNIVFIALAVILTFPESYVLHKFFGEDISAAAGLTVNCIGMTAVLYLFSLFRYSAVYLVLIGIFLHMAASSLVIKKTGRSEKERNGTSIIVKGTLSALVCDLIYYGIYCKMLDDMMMVAGIIY